VVKSQTQTLEVGEIWSLMQNCFSETLLFLGNNNTMA
jgi:hypothetical protein